MQRFRNDGSRTTSEETIGKPSSFKVIDESVGATAVNVVRDFCKREKKVRSSMAEKEKEEREGNVILSCLLERERGKSVKKMIRRRRGDMIVGNRMMCVKSMITEVGLDFEEER